MLWTKQALLILRVTLVIRRLVKWIFILTEAPRQMASVHDGSSFLNSRWSWHSVEETATCYFFWSTKTAPYWPLIISFCFEVGSLCCFTTLFYGGRKRKKKDPFGHSIVTVLLKWCSWSNILPSLTLESLWACLWLPQMTGSVLVFKKGGFLPGLQLKVNNFCFFFLLLKCLY